MCWQVPQGPSTVCTSGYTYSAPNNDRLVATIWSCCHGDAWIFISTTSTHDVCGQHAGGGLARVTITTSLNMYYCLQVFQHIHRYGNSHVITSWMLLMIENALKRFWMTWYYVMSYNNLFTGSLLPWRCGIHVVCL